MVVVLFAVSVIVFVDLQRHPELRPRRSAWPARTRPRSLVKSIEEEWGFDDSLPEQYVTMMKKVFTGELTSYEPRIPVDEQIIEGIPATLLARRSAPAMIWLFFGLLLGYLSAVRAGGWLDQLLTGVSIAGISIPVFLLAPVLLYFLTYKFELFPNARLRAARPKTPGNGPST